MSKLVRDSSAGAFSDSLQTAGIVRAALMRAKGKNPTARDLRRQDGRAEGFEIGRQEGIQEGFQEGRAKAYADAKRELDVANAQQVARLASSIDSLLRELEAQKAQFFVEAEEALAGLAVEVARRAIARELEASRESLIELAHQVLQEATEATSVRLRVSPMDASAMEARRAEIKSACSNIQNLEIVEDKSIDFGCRLETDIGMIDARVNDFLARIVLEAREAA